MSGPFQWTQTAFRVSPIANWLRRSSLQGHDALRPNMKKINKMKKMPCPAIALRDDFESAERDVWRVISMLARPLPKGIYTAVRCSVRGCGVICVRDRIWGNALAICCVCARDAERAQCVASCLNVDRSKRRAPATLCRHSVVATNQSAQSRKARFCVTS